MRYVNCMHVHCKNKVLCLNPHKATSVAAPVPENAQLCALQFDHFTQEAKLDYVSLVRLGTKICVTNCPNGSFLSSEIGEIGW